MFVYSIVYQIISWMPEWCMLLTQASGDRKKEKEKEKPAIAI
jgi:hypothetical protein